MPALVVSDGEQKDKKYCNIHNLNVKEKKKSQ